MGIEELGQWASRTVIAQASAAVERLDIALESGCSDGEVIAAWESLSQLRDAIVFGLNNFSWRTHGRKDVLYRDHDGNHRDRKSAVCLFLSALPDELRPSNNGYLELEQVRTSDRAWSALVARVRTALPERHQPHWMRPMRPFVRPVLRDSAPTSSPVNTSILSEDRRPPTPRRSCI